MESDEDLDKLIKIANKSPIQIVRGVVQMMKRAFVKVDFELIEPSVNYEVSIYDSSYLDKAKQVLFDLECEIEGMGLGLLHLSVLYVIIR